MIGKTEGEGPLPRPRGKREDKNKFMFLTWETWLWSGFVFGYGLLARVMCLCENVRECAGFKKCEKFRDWLRKCYFVKRTVLHEVKASNVR
jgi:hypothetical protein